MIATDHDTLHYLAGIADMTLGFQVMNLRVERGALYSAINARIYAPRVIGDMFKDRFGGSVRDRINAHGKVTGSTWLLTSARAVKEMLGQLRPYLRHKGGESDLIIEACDLVMKNAGELGHGRRPWLLADLVRVGWIAVDIQNITAAAQPEFWALLTEMTDAAQADPQMRITRGGRR
jgi:hypothetical protein